MLIQRSFYCSTEDNTLKLIQETNQSRIHHCMIWQHVSLLGEAAADSTNFSIWECAHQAVAKGNGIWIGKTHLIVERALYDKVLPKVGFSEVKGRSNSNFRIGKQNHEHNGDILPHRKEIEKRHTLNVQPIASEWLTRSAVAKLKVFTDPNCVQKAFIDLNFTEVRVKSLGGMNLIITFQSKEDRLSAIQNPLMTNWFSFFKPWNGEVAGISRLIWLNCRGMPLSVWNALTFKSIGALWGDFITLDVLTLKEETYEVGRMIIATEYKQDNFENGSMFMTLQKAEGKNLDVIQEEGEVSKVGETPDLGLDIVASGSCNVNDGRVVAVKALEVVGATTCPNVILLGDNVEHGGLGKQAIMMGAINQRKGIQKPIMKPI
ncbi:hypothetical protein Vadar_027232 [Vaccinium darrowii]|uniref:Uncharacterized protein n=1 Tax=Vaccinium darrowii TaxID=229202 RepID=A0ACB7XKC8_9ERIC|nr:hypothetical protein Vadar_027232 [Vaccinium darrowii]